MGDGYICYCDNCKKSYNIFLGIGFDFPSEYQELIKRIKSGKYGIDMQNIVKLDKFIAVNAETQLYLCDNCNQWKIDYSMDLYKPKNKNQIIQSQIEKWGFVNEFLKTISYDSKTDEIKSSDGKIIPLTKVLPYISPWNLNDYDKIYNYSHKCINCHNEMRKINDDENIDLKCPDCGKTMIKTFSNVHWD